MQSQKCLEVLWVTPLTPGQQFCPGRVGSWVSMTETVLDQIEATSIKSSMCLTPPSRGKILHLVTTLGHGFDFLTVSDYQWT